MSGARCMSRGFAMFAALAVAAGAVADVSVFLRGSGDAVRVESAFGDMRGLEVRDAKGATMLPWDTVRAVEGQTGTAGIGDYLAMGADLWRARIRIERGDPALAQPLLAKHWSRLRDADGPTAALAAEGLLRCALDANDVRAAADPWLACLRHRAAGIPSRFADLPAVIDAETGLLAELSPFLPDARRRDVIAACEASKALGESGDVAARIVRIAKGVGAGAAASSDADPKDAPRPKAPSASSRAVLALAHVEDIAAARDARALERAVAAFDKDFDEPPSYLGAWRLAAIGTARARMAREVQGDARAAALGRAALQLLAVPAAGLDRTGLVDAYALEEAAKLLRESGDSASAAQLDALVKEKTSGDRT